ncbi:hypothetical protein LSTR_LSTR009115 [Laodelphax striatellus]|uniref:Uncharacterized protein n=1 Tax=Laodelphax striatellus TaxID=195883 RepID=A0A482XNS8_LAOST|nr:hypothetical protein LSTR_LSTR009115 [Laodelphax striatellus]
MDRAAISFIGAIRPRILGLPAVGDIDLSVRAKVSSLGAYKFKKLATYLNIKEQQEFFPSCCVPETEPMNTPESAIHDSSMQIENPNRNQSFKVDAAKLDAACHC